MPIDPGIIGQLQPPPPPPSVEQQARTQLLVEEAKQRRQAVIEEAQDSAAIQTAFRAHQSETGTDYQGVLRDLGTASPRAAMKFQVFLTKQQDDAAKQQQEEWKAQSAQAEGLTRLFQGIDKTPDPAASYAAAKQLLPPNIAKTLPETYDPTVTERIVAHGTNVKEFNDKENQAFERVMGKGTAEQGIGETLALTTSPEDFKQRIARLSLYVPKDMLQPYLTLGPTPEMVQHAQQAALGTKEVATLAGQAEGRQITKEDAAARLAQTTAHDLATEKTAAFNAQTSRGQLGVAQARENREAAQAAKAATTVTIEPGTPAYKVAQDLGTGRMTFTAFRTLEAYNRDAAKKEALYAKAAEINPNFNQADFERGFKFISSPQTGRQLASLDNALSGIPSLLEASNAAKRGGVTKFNEYANPVKIALGSQTFSNLNTAHLAWADEVSGALGYGSATDMKLKLGLDLTPTALGPKNFESVVNTQVIPFLERKRASLLKQASVYGTSENNSSVAPKTVTSSQIQAVAKKNGTTVAQETERAKAEGYVVK